MEMASTYSKIMIEQLLNVHGLANMYRSSNDEEYLKTAADWLPNLEGTFVNLKRELKKGTDK